MWHTLFSWATGSYRKVFDVQVLHVVQCITVSVTIVTSSAVCPTLMGFWLLCSKSVCTLSLVSPKKWNSNNTCLQAGESGVRQKQWLAFSVAEPSLNDCSDLRMVEEHLSYAMDKLESGPLGTQETRRWC